MKYHYYKKHNDITMVSDLIDPVYKVWKEDVIDRVFNEFESARSMWGGGFEATVEKNLGSPCPK